MLKTLSFKCFLWATGVALSVFINLYSEYLYRKGKIMAKDLKYFMRSQQEEIIKVPGPDSFKDENGNVIELEIKILPYEEVQKIYDNYTERTLVVNKSGQPLVNNGEAIWKTKKNNLKAARHVVAEALQYPNLKDPKLMEYYKCADITEMPLKVFTRADEYDHVVRAVMRALGMMDDVSDDVDLEEAKN